MSDPTFETLSQESLAPVLELLFGREPVELDVQRWNAQGFTFSDNDTIRFGLTQRYGGPCGILAPVQCFVMYDLLFNPERKLSEEEQLSPSDEQRVDALLHSLAWIVERCAVSPREEAKNGDKKPLCFVRASEEKQGEFMGATCATREEYVGILRENLALLHSDVGVLSFVMSCIFTRGIETIKGDMDDLELPLVARFGHCTQEIVNLMLVGCAVTNVFDGEKDMGGLKLKGIPSSEHCVVGYLTLLEALRYSKVGSYYKVPHTPIWVVGSSSHYSVLFARDVRIGQLSQSDSKMEKAHIAFTQLDPHENGFIPITSLPGLLTTLGVLQSAQSIQKQVDPDNMGIVLWQSLAAFLLSLDAAASNSQSSSVASSSGPWVCAVCTFMNQNASRSVCEICNSPRPQAPPPSSSSSSSSAADGKEEEHPKKFTLDHFNGLDGPGPTVARMVPCQVMLLESGSLNSQGQMQKRGLREVIHTKWPDSLITYPEGGDPKIS
jgi:hypothetical protein